MPVLVGPDLQTYMVSNAGPRSHVAAATDRVLQGLDAGS